MLNYSKLQMSWTQSIHLDINQQKHVNIANKY